MHFSVSGGTRVLEKSDCSSHISMYHVENMGNWPETRKLKDTKARVNVLLPPWARKKMHSCVR